MAAIDEATDVSKLRITNDDERQDGNIKKVKGRGKRRRSSNKLPDTSNSKEAVVLNKEKKRKSLIPPSFELQPVNKSSKFNDLRGLTLFLLGANDLCPIFAKVNNRSLIQRVVFLIIPGLELIDFDVPEEIEQITDYEIKKCPEELVFFKEHFDKFAITIAPGDKTSLYPSIKALTSIPYSRKQKTEKIKELEAKNLVLPDLLMSYEEFLENEYPIHPLVPNASEGAISAPPEGWVDTQTFEHDGSHTFSLDCEMCETASGKVLTRISLINFNEETILDELVKPEDEIIDYLTQYSGITEELLRNVTTTLKEIQEKICKIISANDILIGHSIENDLNVLKLRHPRIIDTSLIFEHPRGPPFKSSLKYLAKQYLERTIQDGSHDSVEDSKACLDLVKLKLKNNALLGKVIDGESLFKVLGDIGKHAVILDDLKVQNDQKKYIQCSNDDEITNLVIQKSQDTDLVVAKFKELETTLGWNVPSSAEEAKEKQVENIDKREAFKDLNQRLERIYEAIPENSAIILTSGYSNPCELNSLSAQKRAFKNEYQNKLYSDIESNWNTEDEDALKKSMKSARLGLMFLTMKGSNSIAATFEAGEQADLKHNEQAIIEEEEL